MLYTLFEYLNSTTDIPGSGMMPFISFRSAAAIITSLLIAIIFGRKIILFLKARQIGESVRNLGLDGQTQKNGTPTMGGIIILGAILIPVLLFSDLNNIYVQLMILSTIWLGLIGFVDDYIKVFKGLKKGLSGKVKIGGQVVLGIIIGTTMWVHEDIVVRHQVTETIAVDSLVLKDSSTDSILYSQNDSIVVYAASGNGTSSTRNLFSKRLEKNSISSPVKSTSTTIPFLKNSYFDYRNIFAYEGVLGDTLGWILYVLMAIVVITAVSNSANLTDGLDGLTAGISAPIGLVLGILAYLSGNIIYADFLNIMHIPGSGELMVFAAAFVGAILGFLWYNNYPAQIFMGDTGSLAIGGIIATFALLIRKELLLPILCGVFLIESLSVIVQVSYFKYTKWRYGLGKRILLMAPLHHHYQKLGFFETKIAVRFCLIQLLLAAFTLLTLKIR